MRRADLLAPGTNITSSVPFSWGIMSGTSMARPHVAAAFAILRSSQPAATVPDMLQALKASGTPITDLRNDVATPRINILQAAEQLGVATVRPYGSSTYGPGNQVAAARWQCSPSNCPGTTTSP